MKNPADSGGIAYVKCDPYLPMAEDVTGIQAVVAEVGRRDISEAQLWDQYDPDTTSPAEQLSLEMIAYAFLKMQKHFAEIQAKNQLNP